MAELTRAQQWAKQIADHLFAAYPGYRWAVNIRDGVIFVHNLDLSGQWGFIIKVNAVIHDPGFKNIMRAGGEILERYQLHRGAAHPDVLAEIKRKYNGEAIGETAA